MDAFLDTALHDGTPWVIAACLVVFAGVVIRLYTPSGSEISSHPYAEGTDGGDGGTELPSEPTGREEFERLLRQRRARRRTRRKRR
jgi:hypothetical protein